MKSISVATIAAALVFGISAPAAAHVEPDPGSVKTGERTTVVFSLGHGCGDQPTISLSMKADESLRMTGVSDDTWRATLDPDKNAVVLTAVQPIPHDTPTSFSVTVNPKEAGTFQLPVIQHCVNTTNDWIEKETAGQAEPEFPAPALTVTDSKSAADGTDSKTDDSSSSSALMIGGVVVFVVAVGAVALVKRRKK